MRSLMAPLSSLFVVLLLAGPLAHSAELTGTLKAIKERKAMLIGYPVDAYPMSFRSADGKAQGYSIDLCLQVAGEVKKAVGLSDLDIRFVPVTLDARFDAVAGGEVDIECGTSTMTLSRMEKVDFTSMTFVDGGSLLVRKGSAIHGVVSLVDESVAVIPGTTTDRALRDALAKSYVNAKVVTVKDHKEGFDLLESGKISAYATDRVLLVGLLAKSQKNDTLEIAADQFSYEPYGFVVRRGDADFRLVANRALAQLYRSQEIVKIFEKWFGSLGKPSDVLIIMYGLNALPN